VVRLSDRSEHLVRSTVPAAQLIPGPWQVRAGAESFTMEALRDLSEHPKETIRYFAGTTDYETTFRVEQLPTANETLLLDLGGVESMASVRVNGRELSTQWKPPFRMDVSGVVRRGENKLEVAVTGTWRNRLIGHQNYPGGLPGDTTGFKPALSTDIQLRATDGLLPQGLLGPVRLLRTQNAVIP
jgi:hypothetical protein